MIGDNIREMQRRQIEQTIAQLDALGEQTETIRREARETEKRTRELRLRLLAAFVIGVTIGSLAGHYLVSQFSQNLAAGVM